MDGKRMILDPCCGSRSMWFDRDNADTVFGDIRSVTETVTDRSHRDDGIRSIVISPDVQLDFRSMPYPDSSFLLVAFDPPHIVRAGPRSWLAAKYGKLGQSWQDDLRAGFSECWRVLSPGGTLVFKWNETQIALKDIKPLMPATPLFGQVSGRRGMTHWLVFWKPL